MRLSDFDFDLPDALIAQAPAADRAASRLLHLPPFAPGALPASASPDAAATDAPPPADLRFSDIVRLLGPGDLLVMNDSRVINARLHGRKPTGGEVELLVERLLDPFTVLGQLRASHPPTPGGTVRFGDATATMIQRRDRFFTLRFDCEVEPLLARIGRMPLPPYIRRDAVESDAERYQTVYARTPGSVAAPTAGLHFSHPLLDELRGAGVELAFLTLHVGAGTFQPVKAEDVTQHRMHAERFVVPPAVADAVLRTRARGGRVVAVGTTSLRSLESAANDDGTVSPGEFETELFIVPGFRFRVVDALVTNFHLPRSTLLMLVSAFAGHARIRAAYAHAVREGYRFFSYGDAMLLHRAPDAVREADAQALR